MNKYNGNSKDIIKLHRNARLLCKEYNYLDYGDKKEDSILNQLFKHCGKNVVINKPFFCDVGKNISIGDNVFINYNCTILDMDIVEIGSNTMLGPNVSIYTPYHSLDYLSRRKREGFTEPTKIGQDCWIGGGVIILSGVNIGDKCVIGAGSVVTKSTKEYGLYMGNPARFIRDLREVK